MSQSTFGVEPSVIATQCYYTRRAASLALCGPAWSKLEQSQKDCGAGTAVAAASTVLVSRSEVAFGCRILDCHSTFSRYWTVTQLCSFCRSRHTSSAGGHRAAGFG